MTAPTPADIAAIRELENEIPLITFNGSYDGQQAVWRLPAHAARVLCELRNAVPKLLAAIRERDATIERLTKEAAIWDAQASARHADVTALQAEVARLTAERDEAAAKERERIVAEIDDRIRGWQEHSSSGARKRVLELQALKGDLLADRTIARGEPQGIQQGQ